jgi:hypothetical protein
LEGGQLTRVQPVFDELLDRWPTGHPWIAQLWEMAARKRPGVALPAPSDVGNLLESDTPVDRASRPGKVYERAVAPPAAFLRWLIEHPDAMQVRDPITFGARSDEAQQWRRQLFSKDPKLVAAAQREAIGQLEKRLGQRGRNKWWAFEGFTRVDCCLVTDACVLFVEGTRTDGVSPSTLWFQERDQLWRNVEAAREFSGAKQFGVIVAAQNEADGVAALAAAERSCAGSYPHLAADDRDELSRHLLGFVTWPEILKRFAIVLK